MSNNSSDQQNCQPGYNKPQPDQAPPVITQPQSPQLPLKKKEPVTLQSIFLKYKKLNKTVTKIVHKKNNNRTEKWVFFSDGTSVLEDPGEEPEVQEHYKNNQPAPQQPNPYAQHSPNGYNVKNNNFNNQFEGPPPEGSPGSIQPSNVYFYDHKNLVAEYDPENPNNIALTLYEITTLQQKHLYCKYFDPTPHPKYDELASVVDFKTPSNSSVYHNLDLLDDHELLQPEPKKEEKPLNNFWTKTLRRSNKALISKKNKVISKKGPRPVTH